MSATVVAFAPRPGRPWFGGVHAARVGDYHLIAGPMREEPTDWATAALWAAELHAFGYADFHLPRLAELVALEAAFPKALLGDIWWSSEVPPASPTDAFALVLGNAISAAKRQPFNVIAVRRVQVTEPLALNTSRRLSA